MIKRDVQRTQQLATVPMLLKTHHSNGFKYSKLVIGLSACLLLQLYVQQDAQADSSLPADMNTRIDANIDEQTKKEMRQADKEDTLDDIQSAGIDIQSPETQSSVAKGAKDDQIEEALIALKLKKAVEDGLIDDSVLEDYKRETLDLNTDRTSNDSNTPSATSQQAAKGTQNIRNNSLSENSYVSAQNPDDVTQYANNEEMGVNSINPESSQLNEKTFEQKIKDAFAANSVITSDYDVSSEFEAQDISSPAEIEQTLSQLDIDIEDNMTDQVARLDSDLPPLGLESGSEDLTFIEPNSRNTLGLDDNQEALNLNSERFNSDDDGLINNVNNTLNQHTNNDLAAEQMAVDDKTVEGTKETAGLNPEQYLPDYEETAANNTADTGEALKETETIATNETGFFKGLYNRLFKDGYVALPRIDAKVYIAQAGQVDSNGNPLLVEADKDSQPANNIDAAMENITVESIQDFSAAIPKLREVSTNAAQAVGYYDIDISFRRVSEDQVDVIITKLGEPIRVNSRIVDIRGNGSDLPEYQEIAEDAPPLVDTIFNHGQYKKAKSDIEKVSETHGFFDALWLNKSVDIILPDNSADVDLIYDTGQRYTFDDVIFYTIDRETGTLTTDPEKLPVKLELLEQLYEFEKGDDFYRPLITEFTNDLSETRYFNAVNVESVLPATLDSNNSTLGFEDQSDIADGEEETRLEADDEVISGNNDSLINAGEDRFNGQASLDSPQDKGTQNIIDMQSDNIQDVDDPDLQPIEFAVDDETNERLQEIKAKAERLSQLPDDRVLDAEKEEAKSLLGKLSNAISNIAEKILPDQEDELTDSQILADAANSEVDNRKTPEDVLETKSVPLYVFVTADKPKDVDLGIGYGTDTGVRAVARLEHNLINRDGYQAGIEVAASEINRSINIHAKRPWKHPLDDTLSGKLSYVQEEINQGEGNLDLLTNTVKAGIARQIRSDSGWNRTYSLRYRLDELESGIKGPEREDLPVPFNRENAKFNQQALLLGYSMDKTSTENIANPTKGWRQFYSIEAGSKGVLTDTNMAILRAGVNGVYSFGASNKHQLVGSIEGGYIWAEEFEDVPYKLRFFAGGDRSIRGYDYNSLSPLENGYLTGGQVLALGSTEYNYEFKPGLRGAVFADVGNAYDTEFSNDTKLGVGVGVRWASPVGLVRLDLAAGVLEDSIPVRLHFFIGSPLQ